VLRSCEEPSESATAATYELTKRRGMAFSGMLRRVAFVALTRATRRNIPEDGILQSHRRENLKPYIALTGWTL
jgi:hypothetical protein